MNYKTKITEFFAKHRSKIKPLLIALLGVLLLIASSGVVSPSAEADEDVLTRQVREFCEAVEGVGECRVMITYEPSGSGYFSSSDGERVMAVGVACRGARKTEVQKKLKDLLCSVFDIGSNRVCVFPLD